MEDKEQEVSSAITGQIHESATDHSGEYKLPSKLIIGIVDFMKAEDNPVVGLSSEAPWL